MQDDGCFVIDPDRDPSLPVGFTHESWMYNLVLNPEYWAESPGMTFEELMGDELMGDVGNECAAVADAGLARYLPSPSAVPGWTDALPARMDALRAAYDQKHLDRDGELAQWFRRLGRAADRESMRREHPTVPLCEITAETTTPLVLDGEFSGDRLAGYEAEFAEFAQDADKLVADLAPAGQCDAWQSGLPAKWGELTAALVHGPVLPDTELAEWFLTLARASDVVAFADSQVPAPAPKPKACCCRPITVRRVRRGAEKSPAPEKKGDGAAATRWPV